jgi:hypothetical protein
MAIKVSYPSVEGMHESSNCTTRNKNLSLCSDDAADDELDAAPRLELQ